MPLAASAASFASGSIAKLLERLAYQVSATAHSPSVDNVHDLRVAIRRFEQAIVTFRQALSGHEVKRIRRKLKTLMSPAGKVRDFDVIQKLLLKCEEPGAAALKQRLAEQRKVDLSILKASLRRWGSRRTSSKWRAAQLPAGADDTFRHQLPKLARKFLAHGEKTATAKASPEDLHTFRIEAKKIRYTLELMEPLYGAPVREWLDQLKPVQSALGDAHDCRMARDIAARFDATQEVETWLKNRQRKKTREFRKLWGENFGTAAEKRRLVGALRHTPRKPMGRSTAVTAIARRA
jgi:CHAD domain-containing protein